MYNSGVMDPCQNSPDNNINHAVTLIGYGEGVSLHGKHQLYWLILDSWGPGWGQDGVARNGGRLLLPIGTSGNPGSFQGGWRYRGVEMICWSVMVAATPTKAWHVRKVEGRGRGHLLREVRPRASSSRGCVGFPH